MISEFHARFLTEFTAFFIKYIHVFLKIIHICAHAGIQERTDHKSLSSHGSRIFNRIFPGIRKLFF